MEKVAAEYPFGPHEGIAVIRKTQKSAEGVTLGVIAAMMQLKMNAHSIADIRPDTFTVTSQQGRAANPKPEQ